MEPELPRADGKYALTLEHVREDATHHLVLKLVRRVDLYKNENPNLRRVIVERLKRAAIEIHNASLMDPEATQGLNDV